MANATESDATAALPAIRKIGLADLKDALAKGWADFMAKPSHLVFLCVLYPIVGLFLARLSFGYEVMPVLFPVAAGYALIGPFAATGLYEISRRREQGLDTSWKHAFAVLQFASFRGIATLGVLLMVLLIVWLVTAQAIYAAIFGIIPESFGHFLQLIFRTPGGAVLIVVGGGVGFLFAVVVLTVGVVSFPLLIDRDVGAVVALQTSVRAVVANPVTMALWGFTVAFLLVLGSLPLFIGLAVVMPVLGHATWHLYRRVVEP